MELRPTKLIWLLCCTLTVLFTSLGGAQASSSCLPSAAAVKSEYPGTWPRWTYRTHNRDGVKCWYPGTQVAAHKHQSKMVHHRDPGTHSKAVAASIDNSPNWSAPTPLRETNGAGWSAPAPAIAVDDAPAAEQSSFVERFSPVFEVVFFERPTLVRRMEGLISNMQ